MQKNKLSRGSWNIIFFAIAIVLVAADQVTKRLIQTNLLPGQSIPESGFFRLTYVSNTGAAFSIFYGRNAILIVASCIGIILLLTYYFYIYRRFAYLDTAWNKVSLAVILGGTVGNLIDRVRLGYVRDFIDVGPWPIFNIADSCTVVGVIIFAFSLLFLTRNTASDGKPLSPKQ
jgi:signal peptidase II